MESIKRMLGENKNAVRVFLLSIALIILWTFGSVGSYLFVRYSLIIIDNGIRNFSFTVIFKFADPRRSFKDTPHVPLFSLKFHNPAENPPPPLPQRDYSSNEPCYRQ